MPTQQRLTCVAVAALCLSLSHSIIAFAEAPPPPAGGPPADVILVHGRVYTLDAQKPWAQALAIRGDRILAVGSDKAIRALAGPRTRVIDLRGTFALPGFHDAHVHIEATGALLVGANLLDVHEPKAFVERVRAAAARLPRGRPSSQPAAGWFPDQRLTIEEAIDAATRAPAWAAFEEDRKGVLRAGMLADVAVLDTNLIDARHSNPASLLKAKVQYTIVGGRVVFESRSTASKPSR